MLLVVVVLNSTIIDNGPIFGEACSPISTIPDKDFLIRIDYGDIKVVRKVKSLLKALWIQMNIMPSRFESPKPWGNYRLLCMVYKMVC